MGHGRSVREARVGVKTKEINLSATPKLPLVRLPATVLTSTYPHAHGKTQTRCRPRPRCCPLPPSLLLLVSIPTCGRTTAVPVTIVLRAIAWREWLCLCCECSRTSIAVRLEVGVKKEVDTYKGNLSNESPQPTHGPLDKQVVRFACVQQQAGPKLCHFRLKVRCAELQLRLGTRCGVLQQGLAFSLFGPADQGGLGEICVPSLDIRCAHGIYIRAVEN